ncbi:MAG: hypothetical protein ACI32N_07650 [Bulleidia sp.]
MNSKIRKGMIIGVGLCVIAGGAYGVSKLVNTGGSVPVTPVSMLNIGYYENPLSSSGMVYDAQNQSIYNDSTKTITEVFVTVGQQVHAGDRLLSYDLTSLNLAVELSRLETERISNSITLAEHELKQLQNIVPDPEPEVEPEPAPQPEPVLPARAQKDANGAYPYVVTLQDAYNAVRQQVFSYCLSASTPDENSVWLEQRPEEEEGKTLYYRLAVTYTDGREEVSEPAEVNGRSEDVLVVQTGTKDHPYTFRLQENGLVYGKTINEGKDLGSKAYLSFEIYDAEGALTTQWLVRADTFGPCLDTDAYDVAKHTIHEPEPVIEEPVIEETGSGYTAVQLARAIRDKKQEIRKLNLDLKKAQLQLDADSAALSDGIVYAKRDGIVRKACDPSAPPQDGSAFLEVASGTGLYVSGFVSELVKDQIHVGDSVTGYSWNSGQNVNASVVSVDEDPTGAGYYNGEGNPNVSYYAFEAYIEDSGGLSTGDYLELTIGEGRETESLYISRAFVRKDAQGYYVLKDDNGVLVRQDVRVGKTVWGEYMEILEGLSSEDAITFPYGKDAKEGRKTVLDENMEAYYG